MKQKSLFVKGFLLCTMALCAAGCTIGGDDKGYQIVDDPMKSNTEYYIVGRVSRSQSDSSKENATEPVPNATVTISDDIKTTTDDDGVYQLTVSSASTYSVTFSASGLEDFTTNAVIASNAANRSQVTLNVKMAEAIVYVEAEKETATAGTATEVHAPNITDDDTMTDAYITIPADAVDAGTEVMAVVYEEAQVVTPTATTAAMNNISIITDPENAVSTSPMPVRVENQGNASNYLDPAYITIVKQDDATTRTATELGNPTFNTSNNHYEFEIPIGKIAGKYAMNLSFDKQSNASSEYNEVNGTSEVVRIENREYDAQTGVKLNVKVKNGWQYDKDTNLKDAFGNEGVRNAIKKYIETLEGAEGIYYTTLELVTNISGNHVLYYGNKATIEEKTYTFHVMINGISKPISVKLKCYTGYTEQYTNGPISQHSGGSTAQ